MDTSSDRHRHTYRWTHMYLDTRRCSYMGFPGGTRAKEPTCQCKRHKRLRFDLWVRKIPWRRKWQPTPAFLPEKFHGQRSLAGYSPWGHKESGMTEQLSMRAYPYVVSPIASSSILLAGSIIQCHWTTVTSFVK